MMTLVKRGDSERQPVPVVLADDGWRGRLLVPTLVAIGAGVAVVSSLGAPMVPTIAAGYDVSLAAAQWTLTLSLLTGAVVAPVLGRLGDGPYRREVILGVLAVITLGGLLAGTPSDFVLLLVGRGLQGTGLGLMPLAMSVARDHLPAERATPTVALLAVMVIAGMGFGYPISGLAAQYLGFHPTFFLGGLLTGAILLTASFTLPKSSHRSAQPVDYLGAVLLAIGLAALLLAVSQVSIWGATSVPFLSALFIAAIATTAWARHVYTIPNPLVNLHTLSNRFVRTAQLGSMMAGVGVHLLISTVVRYVQTPSSTGYGPGRSVVVAGVILLPFSMASLVVSRMLLRLRALVGEARVMPLGAVVCAIAMVIFGVARSELWQWFLVLGLFGFGIGAMFSSMPTLIIRGVTAAETGSSLGFGQVLRIIGASIGSATSAAVLAAHTAPGATYPTDAGYTVTAVLAVGVWLFAMAISIFVPRFGRSSTPDRPVQPAALDVFALESVEAGVVGAVIHELDDPVGRRES